MTRPYRVLLVDDEDDIRLIVGLNLSLLGMEHGEARNGDEAISALREGAWDGCVLDLAMPHTDGFAVLRALRDDPSLGHPAVMVLSAKGSPTTALEALTLGAHAHITKPFSPAGVAQTLRELIDMTPEQRATQRDDMIARAGVLDRLGMPTV